MARARPAGAGDRRRRDDDRHLHRRRRGRLRRRQGADDARRRVGRVHGVRARRARAVGFDPGGVVRAIASGIYSGTAMLNRLLSRTGPRIGAIVTAGQEDYLRIERGIQTYLGFSYSDRLHLATHFHNEPIVARELVKGVRGRIDVMGAEVAAAARGGRARGGRGAARRRGRGHLRLPAVRLPQRRARDPRRRDRRGGRRPKRGADGEVPVYLASELYPLRRDLPRLNSTLIEAYAAEPSRGTMQRVRDETKKAGAGVRAAGDGLARRHDLDRGPTSSRRPSSPARSAASSAARRWRSGWSCRTCSAPTSAAPPSTSR